jgi:LacI family transcriptional regulator, galactose operon repressor
MSPPEQRERAGRPRRGVERQPRAATIKDVARLAAVDPSTVSRVLRADPAQVVREETRNRILDAARVLRYRPNAVAQSLRTRRTDTFAVIVPSLDNPAFVGVMRGIQAEAVAAGKLVMLVEADPLRDDKPDALDRREEAFARLVLDGRADGLIVAFATLQDRLVSRLAERGLPLVLVNRRIAGLHGSVAVDDARGAAVAVEHLIALGHRRIGLLNFVPETDTSTRRERGFREALTAAGLTADPRWIAAGTPSRTGGREAMDSVFVHAGAERPTAMFCASLLGALGALASLRAHGVTVPHGMSVVAFNDHEIAEDTSPPLTTVRLPNVRMGREAMRMAIRAADGDAGSDDVMIPDPPELVERESTAPPAER